MADEKVQVENLDENEIVAKAKDFWTNFSKPIIYGASAIIVLSALWFGYKYFVKQPKEAKANELFFPAEKFFGKMASAGTFSKDSVNTVLNGGVDAANNTKITGLLSIINNYGGTPAANLAEYMTGACYLHLGEFDKAIKHLKEFNGNGANQIQSAAFRMMGDAYAEQKKNDDALDNYKKAIDVASSKDEATKFASLSRAAMFCEVTGKTKDAIDFYTQIKDQITPTFFRNNRIDFDVDKNLAKLGIIK